jgi:hypothetical protein
MACRTEPGDRVNPSDLLAWLVALPKGTLYAVLAVAAFAENVFPPLPADTVIALGAFVAAQGPGTALGVWSATMIVDALACRGWSAPCRASFLPARPIASRRSLPRKGSWPLPSVGCSQPSAPWYHRSLVRCVFLHGARSWQWRFLRHSGTARFACWRFAQVSMPMPCCSNWPRSSD